jgi:hypothetical protein
MKQDEKDEQRVEDAEQLGKLTDPAADAEGGDTPPLTEPGGGVLEGGRGSGQTPPPQGGETKP